MNSDLQIDRRDTHNAKNMARCTSSGISEHSLKILALSVLQYIKGDSGKILHNQNTMDKRINTTDGQQQALKFSEDHHTVHITQLPISVSRLLVA